MNPEPSKVADIAIDEVRPAPHGFTLLGSGPDRSAYRLELSLDIPIDAATRRVLAELLSQCELTVYRRARQSLRDPGPRRRLRSTPAE